MKLAALLRALPELKPIHPDPDILALHYDSRKVQPGSLYACLPGSHTDGHHFVAQALQQGAVAVLCQRDWLCQQQDLDPGIAWIGVANTRLALAQLAAAFYGYPSRQLALIGVTGTNGKTTTTHLIHSLFENLGYPIGLIGTLGCFFGHTQIPTGFTTPFAPELQQILAQMQTQGARVVTMECSSHALDQHRLDALEFDCAVFTNLTQDHLDYHGTMEAYAAAKQILFERLLKPDGVAILNADDPISATYAQASRGQVFYYGLSSLADLRASDPVYKLAGVNYTLHWQGKTYPVSLPIPGHYNLLNSLAAIATGLMMGQEIFLLLEALAKVPGIPGRLEVVTPPDYPFMVAVDYAHTPDSLDNVLSTARQFTRGRLLCVFGCGGDRDRHKRPQMGQIASEKADLIWLTSDNPRSEDPVQILSEISAGIGRTKNVWQEPDRQAAIISALEAAQPGDVLIIAGKGHETYQIFKDHTIHFDDREVVRQWLERKY